MYRVIGVNRRLLRNIGDTLMPRSTERFAMSKQKGDRWERHYRNALTAEDEDDVDHVDRFGLTLPEVSMWYAVRLPGSGAGTSDDLPDVHLWHVDEADARERSEFAAEVKAFDERTRLTNEEVDALRRYADATGSKAIVIAHGDYTGDRVFTVDELHSTESGYTISKSRDFDKGRSFAEFVNRPTSV